MNIDRLKQYVKQSPKLECFYMCIKGLTDKSLSQRIVGVNRNPYNLIMKRYGDLRPDQNIYYIHFDNDYMMNGFCSLFRFVLYHLAFAEDINMIPVINWGKGTLYYDETIDYTDNAFQYFFNPVSDISLEEVNKCKHVVVSKGVDASAFGTISGYTIPESEIKFLGEIMRRYIHLNDNVKNIINDDFYSEGKTLGVHVRATDFNKGYNRHPKVIMPQEYLDTAKQAFKEKGFNKVFLATDDSSVIDLFKAEFGDDLYYYADTYRSTNGKAVHYGNQNVKREHHKFFLGIEILKDFYTLGRCDGLIAGNSNVSICARIVKYSSGKDYDYVNIIDKGINHNMRETRSLFNPMIRK